MRLQDLTPDLPTIYRLREIGDHLGVHPATVSRALARLEAAARRVDGDSLKLADIIDRAEAIE